MVDPERKLAVSRKAGALLSYVAHWNKVMVSNKQRRDVPSRTKVGPNQVVACCLQGCRCWATLGRFPGKIVRTAPQFPHFPALILWQTVYGVLRTDYTRSLRVVKNWRSFVGASCLHVRICMHKRRKTDMCAHGRGSNGQNTGGAQSQCTNEKMVVYHQQPKNKTKIKNKVSRNEERKRNGVIK